jgi:hypothetical protein
MTGLNRPKGGATRKAALGFLQGLVVMLMEDRTGMFNIQSVMTISIPAVTGGEFIEALICWPELN